MNELQIPTIEKDKIIVSNENEGITLIIYGVTDSSKGQIAMDAIDQELENHPDKDNKYLFTVSYAKGLLGRRWYSFKEFNVYENSEATISNALIKDNRDGYELVFVLALVNSKQ